MVIKTGQKRLNGPVPLLLFAAAFLLNGILRWPLLGTLALLAPLILGFAPLTVGLIMATSLVMSRAADHDWTEYSVTALCTLIFVRTKINPLIIVAAAGAIGYFGIIK